MTQGEQARWGQTELGLGAASAVTSCGSLRLSFHLSEMRIIVPMEGPCETVFPESLELCLADRGVPMNEHFIHSLQALSALAGIHGLSFKVNLETCY